MNIAELWVYPIKSAAGFRVSDRRLLGTGLEGDRAWMVVDHHGRFVTQRELPLMALIRTRLHADGRISMSIRDQEVILQGASARVQACEVWSSKVKAFVEGNDEATELLKDFLKKEVTLVCVGASTKRIVPERDSAASDHRVFFADSHPLLVVTRESLDDLNSRLKEPVPMSRFRPNIVIEGAERAYAEDKWDKVRTGLLELEMRKLCSRCPIVTIDQDRGVKTGAQPLKTLAQYKRSGNKVYFGVRGWALQVGLLREGDTVEILSQRQ